MILDLENINLGTTAGDKTGDGARTGGGKINRNFEKIKTFLETPDAILVQTGYDLVGQNLTFNLGWKWRIATVEYTNPANVVINFPLAAAGKSRLDVVVLTTSNTFLRVPGAESTSTPVAPSAPSGSLYVTVVLVTDGAVNQPEQPEVNGAYVQKSERANVILTGSGVINQLDLVDEKATIVFKGSVTRLNTISYASVPYNGKRITLFNAQATPVTIGNSVSGFGVDFVFPNGQDYVLAPNQTIEFSFDITYFPFAHHMLIGAYDTGKINKGDSAYYELTIDTGIETISSHKSNIKIVADPNAYNSIDSFTFQPEFTPYDGKMFVITNVLSYDILLANNYFRGVQQSIPSGSAIAFIYDNNGGSPVFRQVSVVDKKDKQQLISAPITLNQIFDKQTLIFSANCTVTVPSTLPAEFSFVFRTLAGVTVTWAITAPFTWETTPTTTPEKTTGHFMRRGSTNTILLDF